MKNRYKYLTEAKLKEIIDNPTQMEYEDKYHDVMPLIEEAYNWKVEQRVIKELKARDNFFLLTPHRLSMYDQDNRKICSDLNIREVASSFLIDNLFEGDIFDLNILINKVNDMISPLIIKLEDN